MNEEQQYLEAVEKKLSEKIGETQKKMQAGEKDLREMHDYFWDNYTEFDEYGYELYDNNKALESKVRERAGYVKELFRYRKMQDSPYFGRVDFLYDGDQQPEKCYIGITNLADSAADIPMVYDWRAPVSSLFYDYEKGRAQYEAPMGAVTGEITCKKQYKIRHGQLVYCLESDLNIDDDILKQELSTHADARLKSIVNTIQKEQNTIIRDASHRILAVQGCAGSGKTSVALHRIAYLLYHNRKNLQASQILILSPNGIFADYISRILPELGEENIRELSLDVYAYRKLRDIGEAEDRYDEIEKILSQGISLLPRTEEADYKQTREYVAELDGFILDLESDVVNLRDFTWKGRTTSEERLSQYFYEKLWEIPLFNRMELIAGFLIDEEETLRGADMEEEEKEQLIWRMNGMYETMDLFTLYNRFLASTGREPLELKDGMIRYEDVYPLLYLKISLWKQKDKIEVKHLIIDEMQDYSYLQYRILAKMFSCPMTILGDRMQTMGETQVDVLSFLPGIFGKDLYRMELSKSYRSTVEILELAAAVSGEKTINCISRQGRKPMWYAAVDEEQMYTKLVRSLNEMTDVDTAAVLCLDQEMAENVSEELRERMPQMEISLLTKDTKNFKPGLCVTTFYLAKGLEFDAAMIPFLEKYRTAFHRQALYINITRALHVCSLFSSGDSKGSLGDELTGYRVEEGMA